MKKIISIEIPIEMKQTLEKISKEREMSVSALIRFIVKQWLKENS